MSSSLPWVQAELSLHQHSSSRLELGHTGSTLRGTASTRRSFVVYTKAGLDAVLRPATVPQGSRRSYLSPLQVLMLTAESAYPCTWP